MTSLMPWSPFRTLHDVREEIHRLFDESLFGWPSTRSAWKPAVNIAEHDHEIVVEAAVPGFSEKELSVEATPDRLILRGEKEASRESERNGYYTREFMCESFSRTIALPAAVQSDAVTAALKGGVLTVTLPKAEPTKRRATRVPIAGG